MQGRLYFLSMCVFVLLEMYIHIKLTHTGNEESCWQECTGWGFVDLDFGWSPHYLLPGVSHKPDFHPQRPATAEMLPTTAGSHLNEKKLENESDRQIFLGRYADSMWCDGIGHREWSWSWDSWRNLVDTATLSN